MIAPQSVCPATNISGVQMQQSVLYRTLTVANLIADVLNTENAVKWITQYGTGDPGITAGQQRAKDAERSRRREMNREENFSKRASSFCTIVNKSPVFSTKTLPKP